MRRERESERREGKKTELSKTTREKKMHARVICLLSREMAKQTTKKHNPIKCM